MHTKKILIPMCDEIYQTTSRMNFYNFAATIIFPAIKNWVQVLAAPE